MGWWRSWRLLKKSFLDGLVLWCVYAVTFCLQRRGLETLLLRPLRGLRALHALTWWGLNGEIAARQLPHLFDESNLSYLVRCRTMWRRRASWLSFHVKSENMKMSFNARPKHAGLQKARVRKQQSQLVDVHHIWDVLWRKFCFFEELFRYYICNICGYVFWYVKLSISSIFIVFPSSFSGQAGTEQLCQLARLLARRRLRERNYVSWQSFIASVKVNNLQQEINQSTIFPHEVDMVVAHLLHKVRVSEEGLTIRRDDFWDSSSQSRKIDVQTPRCGNSMSFRQNFTQNRPMPVEVQQALLSTLL